MTDSAYCLFCAEEYGKQHHDSGWKKDFPNKNLVRTMYENYAPYPNIRFKHIKAHTNKNDVHSIGNFHADRLANESFENNKPYALSERIYIELDYKKIEVIEVLGGKWDQESKRWYILNDNPYKDDVLDIFKVYKV